MFLLAFLALIPRSILGFLLVHWIWKSVDMRDLIIKVFLAGPAGIGLSSLASFLWIWANLDLGTYAVLETAGTILISALVLWKYRTAILEFLTRLRPSREKQSLLWLCLLAAGFALYAGEFWFNSLQNPHGRWDAWAIWNVAARFVYRGGEHWSGTFLRASGNPDYPFLLPMSNAITWELLPRETVRGPMALAFYFAVCLAGLLFSLLNRLRDTTQATLGTIVLITMPFVALYGMALYADLPESYYFLASAGLIPLYYSNRQTGIPILAGLLAGLSGWTKNEGLTFVLMSIFAWIWVGYSLKERAPLRNFLVGLSFPLVVIVLFKILLAPQNYMFDRQRDVLMLIQDLDRHQFILSKGGIGLWNLGGGPISVIGILIVYAVIVWKSRLSMRGAPLSALIVLGQLAVYFMVYLITPLELDWHMRTSLGRLYLHMFPLVLLCFFLWVKPPSELLSESEKSNGNAPYY